MASEVIKLNLIPKGEIPVFHCSQFDNGRLITIELYRGEDAYEVPEGYTVELHCRKVDNNIVTLASTLVNTNVVTFTSTTQLTACNGKNLCEVSIKAADDYLIGTLNFWLEVEVDPLKGGINSTSEIHDLYEQIEDITAEVIGDDYYNKTEVDNLLDDKADKSTTYTKTQVDTLLTSKADKSNVYTKSETNTLLSAKADADNVYTKAQVETKLAAKADAASVYTKDETDALLDTKANAATTYTKTEVDTALALKANAADVYTKTQVDNIILDIMPVDTAGPSAIANFTTGLTLPLVECEVGIVATGGNGTPDNPNPINGYSSANITRCGVNLFDKTSGQVVNGYFGGSGPIVANTTTRIVYVKCNPNTTYTVSKTAGNRFSVAWFETVPDVGVQTNGNIVNNTASSITITTGATAIYLAAYVYHQSYDTGTAEEMLASVQIAKGTDTNYHAYTGNAYAIAFGQTVYGGVLDVTRGKLAVNYARAKIRDLEWTYLSGLSCFHTTSLANVVKGGNVGLMCECESPLTVPLSTANINANDNFVRFNKSANGTTETGNFALGALALKDTAYSDVASMLSEIGDYYIRYELETPFDIDLTPVQISALVGENNIYGDTNGNTTVKFKDTIQNYIDKKVST